MNTCGRGEMTRSNHVAFLPYATMGPTPSFGQVFFGFRRHVVMMMNMELLIHNRLQTQLFLKSRCFDVVLIRGNGLVSLYLLSQPLDFFVRIQQHFPEFYDTHLQTCVVLEDVSDKM